MRGALFAILVAVSACAGTDPVSRDDDDDGGGTPVPPVLELQRPKNDGSNQEGMAGEILLQPFVVRVVNRNNGLPVPGIAVDWRSVTPGATMSPAVSQSDAYGYAASYFKANTAVGAQNAEAVLGEQVELYWAIVVPGPPSTMTITRGLDSVQIGQYNEIQVQIDDAYGNGVDNVPLAWDLAGGPLAEFVPEDFTGSGGYAFSSLRFGTAPTSVDITVSVPTARGIPPQTLRFTSY